MNMRLDFTNVEEKEFKLLEEGIHTAFLFNLEEKMSKTGNPMLVATYKIAKGQDKYEITDYMALTEKALFRVKRFLEGFGITVPKGSLEFNPDELVGQEVQIEVEHEKVMREGKERTYLRVKNVIKKESGSIDILGDDDAPF